MRIADICTVKAGVDARPCAREKTEELQVPVISIGGIGGYTVRSLIDCDVIAIGKAGTIGKPRICRPPCSISGTQIYLIPDPSKVDLLYLYACLSELDYTRYKINSTRPSMDVELFKQLEIPDLDMEHQRVAGAGYVWLESQEAQERERVEKLKHFKQVMLDTMFI